ncbi:MAG TPA: bifunctional pyr operon transcriptional regulator/uracil phosphoribosyltransferase PyrR [Verrucomicrobiae bacterium]|nr:bifunctional pyr operon transcriptional regulator/uracil phosphoribosyltransferase PyrR [Verrucomicrobiae bacterium]
MDAATLGRALVRMAHEIVERNPEPDSLAFIGIRTHGVPLAQRLAMEVGEILKRKFSVGEIDISMHRDDLALRNAPPQVGPSQIAFDLTDKTLVLVDDVLFTGRTIRAAMDEISDFGRPQRIQLAILIDRGHRELPIRPDYVGKNVPTAPDERVRVRLAEIDGKDEVVIER